MQWLSELLAILGVGFILWMLYNTIKKNPNAFTGQNINKSIFTLGILALLLIGFIALMVFVLRGF